MAATQEQLTEAETAYHYLMTGGGIAEIRDQNGETIKYTRTNASDLLKYIQWLKRELGLLVPGVGPMRVWY